MKKRKVKIHRALKTDPSFAICGEDFGARCSLRNRSVDCEKCLHIIKIKRKKVL